MPQFVSRFVHALSTVRSPDFAIGGEIGNIRKRTVKAAGRGFGVQRAFALNRAEAFSERQLLLLGNILIGKYQHRIFPERVCDGGKIVVRYALREINIVNFSREIGGNGGNSYADAAPRALTKRKRSGIAM